MIVTGEEQSGVRSLAPAKANHNKEARRPSAAFNGGPIDLVLEPPGSRRLLHSLAYQSPQRYAARVMQVGAEVVRSGLAECLRGGTLDQTQVLCSQDGEAPAATAGRRIALYHHYAASGRISRMVCEQLGCYRALGFDIVFSTNARLIERAGWQQAAAHCWKMIRRRNIGLDFGAWRDAVSLLQGAPSEELLLVNDSVLGPIYPLDPLLARARMLGDGAYGLTESRQGGVHLQSYFVLLRGGAAIADTLGFLGHLRLSSSKWLMVQRAEFGLTRFLARRRHRVAAFYGYTQVLQAVLAAPEERRYLAAAVPRLARFIDEPERMFDILLRWPLNPTTHLWRGLPRCLGFPFLKSDLIKRNPGNLPDVAGWPDLICSSTQDVVDTVREHLSA